MRITVTIIVVSFLIVTSFMIFENVKGDVKPAYPEAGFGPKKTFNTYLKDVNVTIDLYKDYADGYGEFILSNPSNQSEFLELFFDPGIRSKETNITINGEAVDTNNVILSDEHYNYYDFHREAYGVPIFNVSIDSNSSVTINIDWVMDTKGTYTQFYPADGSSQSTTSWEVSYLIIGPSSCEDESSNCIDSWNKSIENVCVSFDVHCQEFNNYTANVQMNESINAEGYPYLVYCYQNFTDPYLRLTINGATITSEKNKDIPGFEFFLIILAIALIFILRKKDNHSYYK